MANGNIWCNKVIAARNQLSQKAHQHSWFPSTCPETSAPLGFQEIQVLDLKAGQPCPAAVPLMASSSQQPYGCRKAWGRLLPESVQRGTAPAVYSPLSGQQHALRSEMQQCKLFQTSFSLHAVTINCTSAMWVRTCAPCCVCRLGLSLSQSSCSARALVRSRFYPTSPLLALMLCIKGALD